MHPIIMPHSGDSCKINLTHFSRLCNFGALLPYNFYDNWSFCINVNRKTYNNWIINRNCITILFTSSSFSFYNEDIKKEITYLMDDSGNNLSMKECDVNKDIFIQLFFILFYFICVIAFILVERTWTIFNRSSLDLMLSKPNQFSSFYNNRRYHYHNFSIDIITH